MAESKRDTTVRITRFDEQVRISWVYSELMRSRNFRQMFYSNLWWGLLFGWISTNYTQGLYRLFYTMKEKQE
jgi:hypothetical protein